MDHDQWITRRNIELFENLLEQTIDHEQMRIVSELLDAERAKLADRTDSKSDGNKSEGDLAE